MLLLVWKLNCVNVIKISVWGNSSSYYDVAESLLKALYFYFLLHSFFVFGYLLRLGRFLPLIV